MDDQTLLDLYKKQDPDAAKETYTRYGSLLCSIARRFLESPEDAEECVQDALLRAWQSVPQHPPDSLKAWLITVTRNLALDRLRRDASVKRGHEVYVLLDELSEVIPSSENVEDTLDEKELIAFLNRWLKTLSAENRTLFLLRYWEGATIDELSARFRKSARTVSDRLYRMRQKLAADLKKGGIYP